MADFGDLQNWPKDKQQKYLKLDHSGRKFVAHNEHLLVQNTKSQT